MNTPPYSEASPREAFRMIAEEGANLVDVRTEAEFLKLHAQKAVWMPIDDFSQRVEELPNQGSLIFICASGVRSALACEYALASGRPAGQVFNLVGGTNAWAAQNLPTNAR